MKTSSPSQDDEGIILPGRDRQAKKNPAPSTVDETEALLSPAVRNHNNNPDLTGGLTTTTTTSREYGYYGACCPGGESSAASCCHRADESGHNDDNKQVSTRVVTEESVLLLFDDEKTTTTTTTTTHRWWSAKNKKQPSLCAASWILLLLLVAAGATMFTVGMRVTTLWAQSPLDHHAGGMLVDMMSSPALPLDLSSSEDELVFAPDVVVVESQNMVTTITFQELAAAMVPVWYRVMTHQVDTVLTPTVLPDQVYRARKIVLKTRDLLDVFGPAYPTIATATTTTTSSNDTDTSPFDLWNRIRHYVSHIYMSVGEFQDLHNAHVLYTETDMQEKRAAVLRWKEAFQVFRREHPEIPAYLAAPAARGRFVHKESHLFWQGVADEQLPAGRDPATPSLQKLGKRQLQRASQYLRACLPYQSIMNEAVHAVYHNLRKELRSLTDEFDLFGWVMFPPADSCSSSQQPPPQQCCCPWPDTVAAVNVLKRARKLLGDINDDWTAHSIYVERGVYPGEQVRLANRIERRWSAFRVWVHDADLDGVLQYLGDVMEVNTTTTTATTAMNNADSPSADRSLVHTTELRAAAAAEEDERMVPPADDAAGRLRHFPGSSSSSSSPSLLQFLRNRKRHPTRQLVIGNEAGDADTIVSALSLAYIESVQEQHQQQQHQKTPIVAIPKADLATQRPEVKLLLELALGIAHPTKVLLFVDDDWVEHDAVGDQVTLVDHNVLAESLQQGHNWIVVEIVDHHRDQGQYLDTCAGDDFRNIAFANGRALVASACTLVAERLRQEWPPPYPASVGLLLLGVILLDSVNLSERVGKVTQRDTDAVADLLRRTDWDALPATARQALRMPAPPPGSSAHASSPDPSLLFKVLQDAKYDTQFWSSLSVRDALRLDYKEYRYDDETKLFGISTVLMPMGDFLSKQQLVPGILQYMEEVGVDFLGIMFAFQDAHARLYRQLAICGTESVPLDDISAFLLRSDHSQGSLDLEEVTTETNVQSTRDGLRIHLFNQRNVKPSRKQIGPILLEFFESSTPYTPR